MYLRFLRHSQISIYQIFFKKLSLPPQVGGETTGGELSLFDLGRYAGKAGKKAAEMGRFFASEWLREPGAQKMLIGKAEH